MSQRPLVTARDLEGDDPVIPAGAILTPLARDLLRKRGVTPRVVGEAGGAVDPLVVANWKSHKTLGEARAFAARLRDGLARGRARVVICPPFTALACLAEALAGAAELGAQDLSPHGEGAHTGEVAARHLVDVGCRFVIVGHSERRHAGEEDALVRRKLRAALGAGLGPILCVGETAEERRAGRAEAVVSRQLEEALAGLEPARLAATVVAYEPRWAIGAGVTPTPAEVEAMLSHVRRALGRVAEAAAAARVPVLYGGSVNARNARELLSLPTCGGALVGGASLDPDALAAIAAGAER
ncbi:MAG: triose-phosphate isomerase [Planctomycetota bacterium]